MNEDHGAEEALQRKKRTKIEFEVFTQIKTYDERMGKRQAEVGLGRCSTRVRARLIPPPSPPPPAVQLESVLAEHQADLREFKKLQEHFAKVDEAARRIEEEEARIEEERARKAAELKEKLDRAATLIIASARGW